MHPTRARLGLRLRSALAWATGGLLLSVGLAIVAYQLVRVELVEDRQDRATAQAYVNARAVRNELRTDDPDLDATLGNLSVNAASNTLASVDGRWFAGAVGTSPDLLPSSLVRMVSAGDAGSQITDIRGAPTVVVGVPIVEVGGEYFEMVPLDDIDRSLSQLARGLAVAAAIATVGAALAGWYVSRTVLRPVRIMADAAEQIAEGDFDARLEVSSDPALAPLQRSFNDMAGKVQDRIEREHRFTSDVSHELRTPLTAMLASVQLARRRVHDPKEVAAALAEVELRGDRFRTLVLDLLEISRIDAGVADHVPEVIRAEELVRAVLFATGEGHVPITIDPAAPTWIEGDKRRLGQALQNLLENAQRYGGGATAIRLEPTDTDRLAILVDDAGPGVPPHERTHVFSRFARGQSSAGSSDGSGLGLALVAEHMRMHSGTVSVEDAPGGGARFRLQLPSLHGPDQT